MWHYDAMSRYASQVPQFAAAFGPRLFVGVTEEFQADPPAFIRRLCDFLEIDSRIPLDTSRQINRSGEPRSSLTAKAMSSLRRSNWLRDALSKSMPTQLKEGLKRANLSRPPLDPAAMAQLRKSFAPDVAAIEAVLGRPIDSWR